MQEIGVGLCNIVKLILNGLWGKFAQNKNGVEIFYITIYEQLSTLLENPIYESNTNVIIARLRLYIALISLPRDSVLYFDTDSIYYSENGEELKLKIN